MSGWLLLKRVCLWWTIHTPPGVRFTKGWAGLLSNRFMISSREIGWKPSGRAAGAGRAEVVATRAATIAAMYFIVKVIWCKKTLISLAGVVKVFRRMMMIAVKVRETFLVFVSKRKSIPRYVESWDGSYEQAAYTLLNQRWLIFRRVSRRATLSLGNELVRVNHAP